MPWGMRFVVATRAASVHVPVSKMLTLWFFLLVTTTQWPSGDGSTL